MKKKYDERGLPRNGGIFGRKAPKANGAALDVEKRVAGVMERWMVCWGSSLDFSMYRRFKMCNHAFSGSQYEGFLLLIFQ